MNRHIAALLGALLLATPAAAQGGGVVRVGIIGLDTSHSLAFTQLLNAPEPAADLAGFRVVAAYPYGSRTIESSVSRIPEYTAGVQKLGVEIVGSIADLLDRVDVVLLETNDGRPHLAQALQVIRAHKRLFIDKPVAASMGDVRTIYAAARENGVPVFSASSLRYAAGAQAVRGGSIGRVLGADAYSPATIEPSHPDLFWYGVHGVELLFTAMGPGVDEVTRVHTDSTDVVVGRWKDGRLGVFRGTRSGKHEYGGTAYGAKGNAQLGPYDGYRPLLVEIVNFFRTGISPVDEAETLEIYAFMAAADESGRRGGKAVKVEVGKVK